MKKVLIIAFYFSQNEVGSIRMRGLTKYLPLFGWQPTVLTIKTNQSKNDYELIETEYEDIYSKWKRKLGIKPQKTLNEHLNVEFNKKNKKTFLEYLIYLWQEIFAYPDDQKTWLNDALSTGKDTLFSEHYDAIITSSFPLTTHLIGNKLKKEHNIAWVADLRDLWSQNPYSNHIFLRKFFEKRLEKKTLKLADVLTTVSPPFAKELKKNHDKPIYSIYNGFDPDQLKKSQKLTNRLSITYTGNLYQGKRDPEKLFLAINELIKEGKIDVNDFSIDFYGRYESWLDNEIKKHELENIVKIHGLIPREEILTKQCESQILLLLTWDNPKDKGSIPGKVFEYLAAKRPILSIGNEEGQIKDIINETNSGIHSSDVSQIKKYICLNYKEFKTNKQIKYLGINSEIEKFNQKNMAKKFAEILNEIT